VPPAIGSFSYDAQTDRVMLKWPATNPRVANFVAAAQHTLATLDQRTGSVTLSINPAVSAHPLGGAVMGKVCDFAGRVKRHPGLYVVDGALIAGSAGLANPSFTIAALAERSLDQILVNDHLTNHADA
jgi:cholesterol oxidase